MISQSCSIEKKTAKKFISKNNKDNILLIKPYFLIKQNLKDSINNEELINIDENIKDSILLEKTSFIKYINDSIFLNKYTFTLKESLLKKGFNVIEENNIDSFFLAPTPSWLINPAQFLLEEYFVPFADSQYFDNILYIQNFILNIVSLHTWIEFSKVNTEKNNMEVLYSAQSVTDKIKGKFKKDLIWGNVRYEYSTIFINVSHVYDLSEYAANKHANYLFDLIMNMYINENLPNNVIQKKFFQYDFKKKRLKKFKEGFIKIQ